MKPGEIVVVGDSLAAYGKIPRAALRDMTFLHALNRRLGRPWNWTIKLKIRAGNKILKKNGFPSIEMLTDNDIDSIRQGLEPPPGALLCKFRSLSS